MKQGQGGAWGWGAAAGTRHPPRLSPRRVCSRRPSHAPPPPPPPSVRAGRGSCTLRGRPPSGAMTASSIAFSILRPAAPRCVCACGCVRACVHGHAPLLARVPAAPPSNPNQRQRCLANPLTPPLMPPHTTLTHALTQPAGGAMHRGRQPPSARHVRGGARAHPQDGRRGGARRTACAPAYRREPGGALPPAPPRRQAMSAPTPAL